METWEAERLLKIVKVGGNEWWNRAYVSLLFLCFQIYIPFSSPDHQGTDSWSLCFPGSMSAVHWLLGGLANEKHWWKNGEKEEG